MVPGGKAHHMAVEVQLTLAGQESDSTHPRSIAHHLVWHVVLSAVLEHAAEGRRDIPVDLQTG